jgi:hypothetical protein
MKMENIIKHCFSSVFALLLTLHCSAQSNTMSTGGECIGAGGSASYSVGQIDYTAIDVAAGSAYLGVQQPYELFSLSTLDENSDFTLVLGPNPTIDELTLLASSTLPLNSYYVLFDEAGKTLMTQPILTESSTIKLDSYTSGNYFLHVISNEKNINTFKIIKTQ